MIHKVTIENFFSIAEKQELVFNLPRNAPDLDCFKPSEADSDTRLPVTVGFFGANASGKSTLLRAIVSSILFILHSFDWKDDQTQLFFQPYRQKAWWGKPTKILIEFDCRLNAQATPCLFRYELHLAHNENDVRQKTVSYELLSFTPKGKFRNLFERTNQKFNFGKDFKVSSVNDPRVESIRPNASIISTLTKFNHAPSIYLSTLVGSIQSNYISADTIQKVPTQWLPIYANDKHCLARLNQALRRLDIGLESMSIEMGNDRLFAKFKHVGLDGDIYFKEQSSGTQRFIENFFYLHYALETGTIVLLDELDTAIHPHLVPELLRWFADPDRNLHGAQLFFTAHNAAILDDLEKEQVFFTEKHSGKSSYVYGARSIKGLRREPSLMKKYLSGELGAIPHIG